MAVNPTVYHLYIRLIPTHMDRTDRLFLERQVRDLDEMLRNLANMRGTLVRQIRRLENRPTAAAAAARRAAAAAPPPPPRPVRPRAPRRDPLQQLNDVAISLENAMAEAQAEGENEMEALVGAQLEYVYNLYRNQFLHLNELPAHWQQTILLREQQEGFEALAPGMNLGNVRGVVGPRANLPYNPRVAGAGAGPAPAPRVFRPRETTRVLKRSEETETVSEPCGVCHESYLKLENYTFNCEHQCCKGCFQGWMGTKMGRGEAVTCPFCRERVLTYTGYRKRAVPQRREGGRDGGMPLAAAEEGPVAMEVDEPVVLVV